jgi:hypothetical protein
MFPPRPNSLPIWAPRQPSGRRGFHALGIARFEDFRIVARAHVIAWRDELVSRGLGANSIRHRLYSLSQWRSCRISCPDYLKLSGLRLR